ncbi:hypothetical protein E8E14_006299 [Neopestalotiopsis sp. 37M]|nr:hypothetical protein E8E14_006299 [Neopestalotiopsis sp. 37M]
MLSDTGLEDRLKRSWKHLGSSEIADLSRFSESAQLDGKSGASDEAHDFTGLGTSIYLKYANEDQDVIQSYGATSVAKLQAVRDRIDPKRVYTN